MSGGRGYCNTPAPVENPNCNWSPQVPTLTEVLPVSKSGPAAIKWTPAEPDDPFAPHVGTLPAAGVLVIESRRASAVYAVVEFPTGWDGRGFQLEKTAGGTDDGQSGYSVFCGRNGQDVQCVCKGFERWGRCKHIAACEALIANGWL